MPEQDDEGGVRILASEAFAQRGRLDHRVDCEMRHRREERQLDDRACDAPARNAGAIDDDDLAFALHPVKRVEHREEHRQGQDQ